MKLFEVPLDCAGRLWIMPCPEGAALHRDVGVYAAAGVQRVVSMLAVDEAKALGLGGEATACGAAGLAFEQHPIVDFGLPDVDTYRALVLRIKDRVKDGEGVAVHCRAGIGRSGMVTSGVLVALGICAQDAIAQVTHARGVSIPDTVEQGSFVEAFARNLRLNN